MLTVVYVFSFIDRQILVILQESIREELGLTDTQLGLMSGFTFAIFYVTFGLPIARVADKRNRRNIIGLSLILWSAMTALSGRATHFWHLLLARIGVGIGEAGCSPPAHSIISDLFPPGNRATAMATYSTGIYMGILIGFLGGGWINEYFGWRIAFMVIGIPGILLALILLATVREPPRGLSDKEVARLQSGKDGSRESISGTESGSVSLTGTAGDPKSTPSVLQVLKVLWGSKAFRFLALGTGLSAYVLYAFNSWMPPLLVRLHDMGTGAIGTWLSLIIGIGGGVGNYVGGLYCDRLGKKDSAWYARLPAIALVLAIPFAAFTVFSGSTTWALIALILPIFFLSMNLGPSIAVTHGLVGPRMRALASAILFFIINIIGLGFGPLLTGVFSDWWEPTLGAESIRWALATSLFACALGAFSFFRAARALGRG